MSATTKQLRFADANLIPDATLTATSAQSAFPVANVYEVHRSVVWSPNGNFTIDSTNRELYINDGTDKTVSVTTGNYNGPAALATQIQTDLNAASSNWTVSYSTTTRLFTIANSGSVTLRQTQTSNAIWDTLGYATGADDTGTSFVADTTRNHTHEALVIDLGASVEIDFFSVIGPLTEVFAGSSSATIKLQANSANSWASPPLDVTLTWTNVGIMEFLDSNASRTYRYWRFYFEDKTNTVGPTGFNFGHMYLGSYKTVSTTLAQGFTKGTVDPSTEFISDNGARWYSTKPKYQTFTGCNVVATSHADHLTLLQIVRDNGRHTPFYLSLDPQIVASTNASDLTKYGYFETDPSFNNLILDRYGMTFDFREQSA